MAAGAPRRRRPAFAPQGARRPWAPKEPALLTPLRVSSNGHGDLRLDPASVLPPGPSPPRKARPEEIWGRGPRASPSTSCLVPPSPVQGSKHHLTHYRLLPETHASADHGEDARWARTEDHSTEKRPPQRLPPKPRAGGWGALGTGAALRSPGGLKPGKTRPSAGRSLPPRGDTGQGQTTTVDHPTDSAELSRRRPSVPGTRCARVRSACALPQCCHEPLTTSTPCVTTVLMTLRGKW